MEDKSEILKGTVDVQGLIAVRYDEFAKAVHIEWACTAPWNNKVKGDFQRYQFMIEGENTQKLIEVYNYEWTEEEL